MNTQTELTPVVVHTEAQSAAIVQRGMERANFLLSQGDNAEGKATALRCFFGAQLAVIRPHVPNAPRGDTGSAKDGDGWKAFLAERYPDREYRTLKNWIDLGATFLRVGAKVLEGRKCKSETVSLLQNLPERLLNGGLKEDEEQQFLDVFTTVTDGKGMMDFIDAHAEKAAKGGARKIKFTCPHCSTKNEGIFGREIKCVGPKCGKKITAKPDVNPEAELKRETEETNADFNEVADTIVTARERSGKRAAQIEDPAWRRLVSEAKWLSKFVADGAKLRKSLRTAKGRPAK